MSLLLLSLVSKNILCSYSNLWKINISKRAMNHYENPFSMVMRSKNMHTFLLPYIISIDTAMHAWRPLWAYVTTTRLCHWSSNTLHFVSEHPLYFVFERESPKFLQNVFQKCTFNCLSTCRINHIVVVFWTHYDWWCTFPPSLSATNNTLVFSNTSLLRLITQELFSFCQ